MSTLPDCIFCKIVRKEIPATIVAETVFGKGVSYMESQIKWHYLPMSDSEYEQARFEIGQPTWDQLSWWRWSTWPAERRAA